MKLVPVFLLFFLLQHNQAQTSTTSQPIRQSLSILDFRIVLFKDSLTHPEVKEVLTVLEEKLTALSKIIRPPQFAQLQKVPIWIEYKPKPDGAIWYHKSQEWVVANGYPVEIAKCVEICNTTHFLEWQKLNQPYMVLHELAHAYHDQVLGPDNADVLAAFQNAVKSKKYESVPYNLGGNQKAYALNNPDEYFAELTEAYLGENDYYPYNRSQLQEFDPMGYDLMKKVWE